MIKALNLVKIAVRHSGNHPWPKPKMLGPQTAKHIRFPGWALYYWPTTDRPVPLFIIMTLFQFSAFSLPFLGVYRLLKTMG